MRLLWSNWMRPPERLSQFQTRRILDFVYRTLCPPVHPSPAIMGGILYSFPRHPRMGIGDSMLLRKRWEVGVLK